MAKRRVGRYPREGIPADGRGTAEPVREHRGASEGTGGPIGGCCMLLCAGVVIPSPRLDIREPSRRDRESKADSRRRVLGSLGQRRTVWVSSGQRALNRATDRSTG